MVFNVFNVVNHFVTHASNAIYLFLLGQQFQCCCDEPLQTDTYYCIADLFLPLFILLYMCEPVFFWWKTTSSTVIKKWDCTEENLAGHLASCMSCILGTVAVNANVMFLVLLRELGV